MLPSVLGIAKENIMAENDLGEQLKTLHNLTEISLILYNLGKTELLPTILEIIFLEIQQLIDDFCVKE